MTAECWEQHILVQHPELYKLESDVERTIEQPEAIYQSKFRRRSHLYFRRLASDPAEYVMVTVDVRERSKRGFVETPFSWIM